MGIEEQIDRLNDLGEDIKSRLDLLVELASDHFAGANKMVAKEPAKEAPKKWRILEPEEVVQEGDWVNAKSNLPSDPPNGLGWRPVDASVGTTVYKDEEAVFARLVVDEPAKEPEPAWEPKVGDWVRVTRPENWREWKDPLWREEMHIYDGKVFEFVKWSQWSTGQRAILQGIDWFFHRDWLSPAEPPAKDGPAEPEYREPVLPADAGKVCEFSDDSMSWEEGVLIGWRANFNTFNWKSELDSHRYARIKKDA